MKAHGIVIALAVVLAAGPVVGEDEHPADRQMRLLENEESPVMKDVPVEPPGSEHVLVTVQFSDTEIREAAATIAKIAGAKVQVDEKVKGRVSLTLKDVPWQNALTSVAQAAKAALVRQKDGSFRIQLFFLPEAVQNPGQVNRSVDGLARVAGRVLLPDGKAVERWTLVTGQPSYRVEVPRLIYTTATAPDKILKDLRAAIKSLRAAGLEKEAKAAEKELARREAARKALTVVTDAGLTNAIQALRRDVAALREEVRELTALVRKMAEKE